MSEALEGTPRARYDVLLAQLTKTKGEPVIISGPRFCGKTKAIERILRKLQKEGERALITSI